jgi:hypothetical protein
MAVHIHSVAFEVDAVSSQAAALLVGAAAAAQGDPPAGAHHPVPGDPAGSRTGEGAQGPAHGPGAPGDPQEGGDLAVGGDAALRDLLDLGPDSFKEAGGGVGVGGARGSASHGIRSAGGRSPRGQVSYEGPPCQGVSLADWPLSLSHLAEADAQLWERRGDESERGRVGWQSKAFRGKASEPTPIRARPRGPAPDALCARGAGRATWEGAPSVETVRHALRDVDTRPDHGLPPPTDKLSSSSLVLTTCVKTLP